MFSARTSDKPAPLTEVPRSHPKAAVPSIISKQLVVHGNLTTDGDIQVDGTIEGDIKTSVLTIGEGGTVKGAVVADTVTVSGTVDGQIRAKAVTLSRTARMQGDIWHESLAIEAGARFEGSCKHLSTATQAEGEVASWAMARRAGAVSPAAVETAVPQAAES